MKRRMFFVFLALMVLVICMAGCNSVKGRYIPESLSYEIFFDDEEDRVRIEGEFWFFIDEGTASKISYSVVGYDLNREEIWRVEEIIPLSDAKASEVAYRETIWAYESAATQFVKVEDVSFAASKSLTGNTWMMLTFGVGFGVLVAGAIALLIVFFVREKVKEKKE